MNIDFTVFFDIKNFDEFYNNIFFDLDKSKFNYRVITYDKMKDLSQKENILKYQGYIYMQKDSFIIYRNNCIDGWINRIRNKALNNNLRVVHVVINDEKPYPGYQLQYYNKGKERIIYSIYDGSRWMFYSKGEQQSFENNNNYNEKGPTKKFNKEKILEYCKNLGIIIDENFFKPTSKIFNDYHLNNIITK